jgi:hypothetical protein
MGNILKVVVRAANIHDTVAGCGVFRSGLQKYPWLLAFVEMKGIVEHF